MKGFRAKVICKNCGHETTIDSSDVKVTCKCGIVLYDRYPEINKIHEEIKSALHGV